MPPHTLHDRGGAPAGFEAVALRGPFFGGRTVFIGPGGRRDLFAARITGEDCNGLGITHGGVIATLADIFLVGFLAGKLPADARLVTAGLAVDYLGPSSEGDWLTGRIHAHRVGRSQCIASGELRVDDRAVALIKAHCVILSPERSPS